IQKQIISYKDKISSYNEKIIALEEILASDTSFKHDDRATVIRILEMKPQTFKHFIQVSGKVTAEEEAFISPEINGQISRILVKEGQRVNSGQLLLVLNTDVTEKTIQEVRSSLELLTKLYEKQKSLWDQNIGTEVQYLQAKTNKESTEARLATLEEQLKMAQITAPFSGIVEDIMVKEGEMAMPGARLVHMVNLKDLSIEADVSESYLNDIRTGEIVEVEFPTFPGIKKMLPIIRVGSVIDNLSRTFQLELGLKNPDEKIKPNQLATLRINDFVSENAMVVPSLIIKQDITGYYLYVAENRDGVMKSTKKYIVPGRSAEEFTMVNEGLNPGMLVVVEGFNLVKDGTEVRILP
ncbi:MAG: efflux RND transporter periplasmic adaptor subunit, partial [Bacteroidales bacterium]|nr:efflux RND transporter periplasmic adaptor subunit [Bacteroidales bacterium]